MVKVPVTSFGTREVQPLGNERFQFSRSRNLVGPALEQAGRALGQAAEDFDQIEATYDEADALRIANEYADYERQRLRSGENAYLNSKGFNAGEGMEPTLADLQSGADNLLRGARSERAREMARRSLTVRIDSSSDQIARHAATEMSNAREEQSVARINGAIEDAVNTRGTEQFAVNLGVAQMELRQRGQRLGWSPDQMEEESAKLTEGAYSRSILAIDAEDGEPTRALETLEQVKDLIGPEQEAKLRNMLNPRVDAAWADDLVNAGGLDGYLPEAPKPQANDNDEAVAASGEAGVVGGELRNAGFSPQVVAGFLGNFEVEGGYGGARGDGGSASGIGQWRDQRRANFRRMFGKDPHGATKEEQARFVVWEMRNPESAGMTRGQRDAILNARDAGEAAELIDRFYERSSGEHRPKRVAAAQRMFSGAPGAPGVAADPRLNGASMREAVDKYVAANPGISERRKQALYAAAERSVSNNRADRAQAEQDSDRRLMDWLTHNKPGADDLTDIGQIPASVLAGVSPSTMASLNSRVQATTSRIRAGEDERAQQLEENAVFQLYSLTDQELRDTDLRRYSGIIDQKTLGPWIDRQQALRGSAETKPVDGDRIAGKIDQYGKPFGASRAPDANKDERQAWIKLREYVEGRVQGRPNKEVSDEDLRAIVISGMGEVEVVNKDRGILGRLVYGAHDPVPRSQVPQGRGYKASVPAKVQQEIAAGLRSRGINPTPELIVTAYREGVARGVYEPND